MPRIRTLKPEFFRSPSTAKVDFPVRIFYQALWCWADDFGIGETNINGLLGFAFPDDDLIYDEESRTFRAVVAQDLRRFCADVAQHFDVAFYTVRGRHYFAIPSWDQHQKTERRTERRKNPTPDDPDATPDLRFTARADFAPQLQRKSAQNPREMCAGTGEQGNRGTGEQGNRGTGEQNKPPYPPAHEPAANRVPAIRTTGAEKARDRFLAIPTNGSTLSRQIAKAYSDSLPVPIEAKLLGELGGEIDRCLRSAIPPEAIAAGIQEWTRSDSFAPSQIPKFVHKAANRSTGHNGIGKPTLKAIDYDTAAEQLIAALETP